jgi:hypothetical protein
MHLTYHDSKPHTSEVSAAKAEGAGAPEQDEIGAELDRILTDEVVKIGGRAISGWCADEPEVVASIAFEEMWRAIRTSQKKGKSP